MANKAKSTQLRKLEVSTTAAGVFTKIGQLSDTNFATGSAQFLDATNYDSGRKEYIAGLANPRTTLYFKGTTGQGEVMTFTSECGGWQVTGGANSVEMGQVTVRPRDIVWKGPEAPQGGG
jgi:hypothetical protein